MNNETENVILLLNGVETSQCYNYKSFFACNLLYGAHFCTRLISFNKKIYIYSDLI
jgi:hypothetical protein